MEKGRLMLAVEHDRAGKASMGKAAEIAGLPVSELMDTPAQFGVPANLEFDDYLRSLSHPKKARQAGTWMRPSPNKRGSAG